MTTIIAKTATATFDWHFGANSESAHFSKQNLKLRSLNDYSEHYPNNISGGIMRHEYNKNNFVLFRLRDHIDRLIHQAHAKGLGGGNFSRQNLINGAIGVAQLNSGHNYIRPLIYEDDNVDLKLNKLNAEPKKIGAVIIPEKLELQGDIDYISFTNTLKLDNYKPGLQDLLENMALVDRRRNKLIVSNDSYGIALETVLIVAQNTLRLKIERRNKITLDDIQRAEELFLCETKAGVLPVTTVEFKGYSCDIDEGFVGEITRTLMNLYSKTVCGQIPDYHRWCEIIPKTFKAQSNHHKSGQYFSDT